ncbi:MAG: chemotaxis protein CheW [Deferribacterales bacterium]
MFDINDVLYVDYYKNVVNELTTIKIVDILNSRLGGEEVIFLGFEGMVLGIRVDKIITVKQINEIFAYNNEKNMLEYIKGYCHLENNTKCYILDVKKIFEVAYEK